MKAASDITNQMKQGSVEGPTARWSRKQGGANSSINRSLNRSVLGERSFNNSQNRSSINDSFKKSLGKPNIPHAQKVMFNKKETGDRFIPCRSTSNLSDAFYNMNLNKDLQLNPATTMAEEEYKQKFKEHYNNVMGIKEGGRILSFSSKPDVVKGYDNGSKVLYSSTKKGANTTKRHIPSAPEKVLDAPDIVDDFYLELMDWSRDNKIAVGLGSCVYLWDASSGDIVKLVAMDDHDQVCSLKWSADGNFLAVGDSCSMVQLWDVERQKRLRKMRGHTERVNTLSWNKHILSSGSTDKKINNHDVRIAEHLTSTFAGHEEAVCGIEWSHDGDQLASGGNDNLVQIWNKGMENPVHTFTEHQSAVKALAWHPRKRGVLATGGGSSDRHIRLWNTQLGCCNHQIDTKSQVCSLKWSSHYDELMSGHGYHRYQLSIWSYPSMTWVKDLEGHTGRVLALAMSPDGQTVCSAGADETLRMWKCFQCDDKKLKKDTYIGNRKLFGQPQLR